MTQLLRPDDPEDDDYNVLTLRQLRRARIGKYDVAFKNLFSLENSTFRSVLGVPDGQLLQEEFPGLEFRRADGMLFSDGTIYHVEFQAKNLSKMPARMHEYAHLIDKYKKHYRVGGEIKSLNQKVVYVGPGANTMDSPYHRWGTTHEFESFGITSKFDHELHRRLMSSGEPHDWIIALLLVQEKDFQEGFVAKIAGRLNAVRGIDEEHVASARILLLIAGILRNVSQGTMNEVESMLRANIGDSSLLSQFYDAGANEQAVDVLLDSIERGLGELNIFFTTPQRNYIATFDVDALSYLNLLAIRRDYDALQNLVTPPTPKLGLTRNGLDG
ncbi:hypothetical protein E0H68_03710 [Rhizobium leguminosarum bv. viciae]|uniref:hypothetical protein n=1 Tax=Rhizobium leguminosarum TaxID=384 RepID=UPI001039A679|nr:hypothetical protein [Rhizobium leguminosarum]TCA18551.1 hypothetical protein E0H68_03710 [Rhizobium leguminosarum bv. viciae]